ncbi:MAG: hypothetical protein Kow0047_15900 [Anaerolineae bacterium]
MTAAQVRLLMEALHVDAPGGPNGQDEPVRFPKSYLEQFVKVRRERQGDG